MNEKLLQYIWNYKILTGFDFKDIEGNAIEILDYGTWNIDAGPDFINTKIRTKGLVLAGNIELHLRSSDWVLHKHSSDSNYGNIVLHVVYEHDMAVDDLLKRNIPTLELKPYISRETVAKHQQLMDENQFIPCEKIFDTAKIPIGFHEETLLKKLDEKSIQIETDLKRFNNDFEAVLFHHIAYAFGLKINASIFKELVESVDFSIIRKISRSCEQLEALFFGKSGWLNDAQDAQTQLWKREYYFLKAKYQLTSIEFSPKFLRLRPPNFPTLRLSQLAHLYHREQGLFSKIMEARSAENLMPIFNSISASGYWDNHYTFGKPTEKSQPKTLTKSFVYLVLINAVLPIKYAYHKHHDEGIVDEILSFYEKIAPENNSVIEKWQDLGVETPSSLQTQALIYHYKNFCQAKNCLNCSIGYNLLKHP